MKKFLSKFAATALALAVICGMSVVSFADDPQSIPNGTWKPSAFSFTGGTGKTVWTCDVVHVTDEGVTAELVVASPDYTKAEVGDVVYEPHAQTSSSTTFIVPVMLNEETVVNATTSKMGGRVIEYKVTVSLDSNNLKKYYYDGFYTTEVMTARGSYSQKPGTPLNYPSNDYPFPVTIQIEKGKIVDVAYTKDAKEILENVNTSSDFNYLLWAMEGHNVTDYSYNYLAGEGKNYDKYGVSFPKNGRGMREQIIEKNGTEGVDTVTSATLTSIAIKDSVDQSLEKANKGEKDDPAPVLPVPDTSEDIIPADGVYTVKNAEDIKTIGLDVDSKDPIVLTVKDGKMTAQIKFEQRKISYPHMFAGTEKEALAAGESGWLIPEDYEYGYKYPGSLYKNVSIKSLDKANHIVCFAGSSGNWFNRLITIPSDSLVETAASLKEKADASKKAAEVAAKTPGQAAVDAARKALEDAKKTVSAATSEEKNAKENLEEVRQMATEAADAESKAKDKYDLAQENYNAAVATYGETSDEAKAAKKSMEDAKKSYDTAVATRKSWDVVLENAEGNNNAAVQANKSAAQAVNDAEKALKDAENAKKDAEAKAESKAKAVAKAKALKVKGLKVKVKSRKATVSYKKTKGADAYRIQYRVKGKKWSDLKKSVKKVKVTSKKLKKGKKYQFRVCTITNIDGKKVYGKWKTSKTVKIK